MECKVITAVPFKRTITFSIYLIISMSGSALGGHIELKNDDLMTKEIKKHNHIQLKIKLKWSKHAKQHDLLL